MRFSKGLWLLLVVFSLIVDGASLALAFDPPVHPAAKSDTEIVKPVVENDPGVGTTVEDLSGASSNPVQESTDSSTTTEIPAEVKSVVDGVQKFLPPASDGHAIHQGQFAYAYVLAVVGFLLLVGLVMLMIWFGMVVVIFAMLVLSIGSICYALNQGIITTWEQLFVALLYTAIINAVILIPLRALLPQYVSAQSAS
jgi:hypothetical protein